MIIKRHYPIELTASTYNHHGFSHTACYRRTPDGPLKPTPFYFGDRERRSQFTQKIEGLEKPPTFLGFTELWDADEQKAVASSLSSIYPYAILSPTATGLGGLISKFFEDYPFIANRVLGSDKDIEEKIRRQTRKHYESELGQGGPPSGFLAGAAKVFFQDILTEDLVGGFLSKLIGPSPIWGAGLLFLSQYPIYSSKVTAGVSPNFFAHPEKADWEHLANKGVLWTTVRVSAHQDIRVCLGHYQEGPSEAAVRARKRQITAVRKEAEASDLPVIVMGDMNVEDNTDEDAWMIREFGKAGLKEQVTGPTYINPNPYQAHLTGLPITAFKPSSYRLDRIFARGLKQLYARVLRDEFLADHGQFYLSDHDPVFAAYQL